MSSVMKLPDALVSNHTRYYTDLTLWLMNLGKEHETEYSPFSVLQAIKVLDMMYPGYAKIFYGNEIPW